MNEKLFFLLYLYFYLLYVVFFYSSCIITYSLTIFALTHIRSLHCTFAMNRFHQGQRRTSSIEVNHH